MSAETGRRSEYELVVNRPFEYILQDLAASMWLPIFPLFVPITLTICEHIEKLQKNIISILAIRIMQ